MHQAIRQNASDSGLTAPAGSSQGRRHLDLGRPVGCHRSKGRKARQEASFCFRQEGTHVPVLLPQVCGCAVFADQRWRFHLCRVRVCVCVCVCVRARAHAHLCCVDSQ